MKICSKPLLIAAALAPVIFAPVMLSSAYAGSITVVTAGQAAGESRSDSGDRLALNPDHPQRYTVVKGDTLWDISAMFLRDPWLWPEIWYVNPQVENPHLIYPGDVLELVWVDGKPQLRLQRGDGTEKWTPEARITQQSSPIPTIPFDRIAAFLSRAGVVDKREFDKFPHIVAMRDGMVAGAGDEVYVRKLEAPQEGDSYRVIRLGQELRDPNSNKYLGHEVVYVGEGTIQTAGEVSNMMLNDTTREAKAGDKVIKYDRKPPLNFYPRGPEQEVNGQILAVKDGVSRIGQYQMVIVNLGLNHGMEEGHVLSVWQKGAVAKDRFAKSAQDSQKVTLPDENIGLLMILKPEENTSYALIMDATSEIRILDRVKNP